MAKGSGKPKPMKIIQGGNYQARAASQRVKVVRDGLQPFSRIQRSTIDDLSSLLRHVGLHPDDQSLGRYPLFPMSFAELHRRLHEAGLVLAQRQQITNRLWLAGLLEE
jgi:hypothetical protein